MAYLSNGLELIIKLYSDKPSRIGIKYRYEFEAIKAYEELITKYRGDTFIMKVEPVKEKINLVMQSEQGGGKVVYKDVSFRPEQLKRLEALSGKGMSILFVHVYSDGNQLFIAKPYRKQEFVSVTGYQVIGSESFR